MSKDGKLSRRQIEGLRKESMRWAAIQLKRLRMSTVGEPAIETCECGKEYEVFPNDKTTLTQVQIAAIKYDVDKVYPGITDEDFEKHTEGVRSTEEIGDDIVDLITDEDILQLAVNHDLSACIKARDILNRLIPDGDVVPISTCNTEEAETRH